MTRTRGFRMAAGALAAALAAILLAILAGTRPAEATFPGANGGILFERQITDVFVLSPGGAETKLVEGSNPAVSPDGSRIAYVSDKNIWVMNADGSGKRQLTTDAKFNDGPAWSPDGTRIAFSAGSPNAFDDADVFAINADGSGKVNLTNTQSGLSETDPAWSPDGTKIAYTRSTCDPNGVGGINCVFVMDSDGANQTNLTPEIGLPQCPSQPSFRHKGASEDPSWSPDGNLIAFKGTTICPNGSGTDIWVMNFDGSGKVNFTNDNLTADRQPVFSPDRNEVAFTSDRGNNNSVQGLYKLTLSTGSISSRLTAGEAFNPDWRPDPPTCDISGGATANTLTGTPADETICGLGGDDTINGGGGDDLLLGGDGSDSLSGVSGRSTLNGGSGNDTATFAGSATPVEASLTSGFARRVGTAPIEGVALVGIENLTGTTFGDELSGSAAANDLIGGPGPDALSGLAGADTLRSKDGAKNDRVSGGADRDRCVTDRREVRIKSCP